MESLYHVGDVPQDPNLWPFLLAGISTVMGNQKSCGGAAPFILFRRGESGLWGHAENFVIERALHPWALTPFVSPQQSILRRFTLVSSSMSLIYIPIVMKFLWLFNEPRMSRVRRVLTGLCHFYYVSYWHALHQCQSR